MTDSPRSRPPALSLEENVFVSLQRTAAWLLQGVEQLLKEQGLSPAQYNVLRILRGAGPAGLSCREIAERMITRDPDMTRLLDRMEKRGLVARARQQIDRRVVTTRVTPAGLKLLKALDNPVYDHHRRCFRHIPPARLKALALLLERVRCPAPA